MKLKQGHVSIRFHLARGEHYHHWQIRYPDGDVCYLDPSENVLLLLGARLRSQRKTAEKIFAGEHKTVCAWIEVGVDGYSIVSRNDDVFYQFFNLPSDVLRVEYNPRIAPYWRLGGEDVDNKVFARLVTHNRSVCLPRKSWLSRYRNETNETNTFITFSIAISSCNTPKSDRPDPLLLPSGSNGVCLPGVPNRRTGGKDAPRATSLPLQR